MTTIKTQDLTGAALDYMTGVAVGETPETPPVSIDESANIQFNILCKEWNYRPSTDWSQGGPLIQWMILDLGFEILPNRRGEILVRNFDMDEIPNPPNTWEDEKILEMGLTLLPTAMKALVAAKLGDEVDVPEELV